MLAPLALVSAPKGGGVSPWNSDEWPPGGVGSSGRWNAGTSPVVESTGGNSSSLSSAALSPASSYAASGWVLRPVWPAAAGLRCTAVWTCDNRLCSTSANVARM